MGTPFGDEQCLVVQPRSQTGWGITATRNHSEGAAVSSFGDYLQRQERLCYLGLRSDVRLLRRGG